MKLKQLTKEQEELQHIVAQEWKDRFFNTKEIDKEAFESGINWIYTDLLKKNKPKIVYCDSWISCLFTIGILKQGASVGDSVRNSVGDSVRNSVGDSVRASVGASVMDSVRNSVGDSVRNPVRNSVWASVGASVMASVGASVRDSVRASVMASVGASVMASVGASVWDYSNMTNSYANFGWVSFYDFFERIGILQNDLFSKYKTFIQSCAFQVYEYDNIVFAIQPPLNISLNNEGLMHDLNKKAFEFRDGSGFYYVNGRELQEDIFKMVKDKKYTFEMFSKESNEDVKSAIIAMIQELHGDEYLFNFLSNNLKEIDTYTDIKKGEYLLGTTRGQNIGVYTLFKGTVNNENVSYVRCFCPSTDRIFFLGVENHYDNAKDAIASLYRVPRRLKDEIRYIQRQGERFSTVFSKEGNQLLKGGLLSKDEMQDVVSVSGKEYFEKMRYEY